MTRRPSTWGRLRDRARPHRSTAAEDSNPMAPHEADQTATGHVIEARIEDAERAVLQLVDPPTEPPSDETDGESEASGHFLDIDGDYRPINLDADLDLDDGESGGRWRTPAPPIWLADRDALREIALSDGVAFIRWLVYLLSLGLAGAYLRLIASVPRGILKALGVWWSWMTDAERFEKAREDLRVSGRGDINEMNATHDAKMKSRAQSSAVAVFGAVVAGSYVWWYGNPWPLHWELAALGIGLPLLGWWGRESVEPVLLRHVVFNKHHEPKPTPDLILEALADIGIGANPKAKKPVITQPPVKVKTGWECIVDLPGATTVESVLKRHSDMAAALRRTKGKVWLSQDPEGHAASLRIVINRKELREGRMPPCPLLNPKFRFNYFTDSVHVGYSEMGEPVLADLAYKSALIGGQAGSGKTVAMNQFANTLAMDPRVELHIFDNKGGTDFAALGETVAHTWRAGSDEDDQQAALEVLRDLNRRMNARYKNLHKLGGERRSPKTTDDLASRRDLDYHPVAVVVDEVQEWFEFSTHKAEFAALMTPLIKKGRAMGFTFVMGTQEVRQNTIPRSITNECKWRYCLMVADHTVSELILGTGTYARGIRPSNLTAADVGIGFVGTSYQDMTLTRGFYLDDEAGELDIVAKRARAIREAEERLSGLAAGAPDVEPDGSTMGLLDRTAAAWPEGVDQLQWPELLDILRRTFPDIFADTSIESLSSDVRTAGGQRQDINSGQLVDTIKSVTVRSRLSPRTEPAKGMKLAHLRQVLDARSARPEVAEDADLFLDSADGDESGPDEL